MVDHLLFLCHEYLFCSFKEKASEAMEVFDEMMESEVSIIVPHIAEIVQFCLEVCPHIFIVIVDFE